MRKRVLADTGCIEGMRRNIKKTAPDNNKSKRNLSTMMNFSHFKPFHTVSQTAMTSQHYGIK